MTIKSDLWLRAQSERPTHVVEKYDGSIEYAIKSMFTPMQQQIQHHQDVYRELLVSNEKIGEVGHHQLPVMETNIIRPITEKELNNWKPMIEPFHFGSVKERAVRVDALNGHTEKIISYGTSSFGYDLRIGNQFKIFTNVNSSILNPKKFDTGSFVEHEGESCIIPPNSFALASSLEYIRMPRNITGIVLGKSTYARCGIVCIATPLEAEWEGHVTLEFANTTPLPAMLFANEGAAQVLFFEGENCFTSYADRGGKYQHQEAGPVLPKM